MTINQLKQMAEAKTKNEAAFKEQQEFGFKYVIEEKYISLKSESIQKLENMLLQSAYYFGEINDLVASELNTRNKEWIGRHVIRIHLRVPNGYDISNCPFTITFPFYDKRNIEDNVIEYHIPEEQVDVAAEFMLRCHKNVKNFEYKTVRKI